TACLRRSGSVAHPRQPCTMTERSGEYCSSHEQWRGCHGAWNPIKLTSGNQTGRAERHQTRLQRAPPDLAILREPGGLAQDAVHARSTFRSSSSTCHNSCSRPRRTSARGRLCQARARASQRFEVTVCADLLEQRSGTLQGTCRMITVFGGSALQRSQSESMVGARLVISALEGMRHRDGEL